MLHSHTLPPAWQAAASAPASLPSNIESPQESAQFPAPPEKVGANLGLREIPPIPEQPSSFDSFTYPVSELSEEPKAAWSPATDTGREAVPQETPPDAAKPQDSARPLGLVLVVIFWLYLGLSYSILGLALLLKDTLLYAGLTSIAGPVFITRPDLSQAPPQISIDLSKLDLRFIVEFGLALDFSMQMLGLFTLAMCYGLWTKQSWALRYAPALALVYIILSAIWLFLCAYLLTGVVTSLLRTLVSVWVRFYLGLLAESEWASRVYGQLRTRRSLFEFIS
jgi:hypothetical protein